jgi:8-oxo-dGTP pyrophosphatase MutT (NUDIX family)
MQWSCRSAYRGCSGQAWRQRDRNRLQGAHLVILCPAADCDWAMKLAAYQVALYIGFPLRISRSNIRPIQRSRTLQSVAANSTAPERPHRTTTCSRQLSTVSYRPTVSMAAPKAKPKFEVRSYTTHKNPAAASPSASIILVSPTNEILLLHRVKSSSAFPSAHVFPGGNLDPQDGDVPSDPKDPARHKDSLAYRTGAIRELFEETGILLAKESASATSLLSVSPEDRLAGRQAVHSGKMSFKAWLSSQSKDAVLHTDGLIPFTHWVTPPYVRCPNFPSPKPSQN